MRRCSTPSSWPPGTTHSQDFQASKAWRNGAGGSCTATRTRCQSRSVGKWWWWWEPGRAARTSPWNSAAWPRRCTSPPGPWRRSPLGPPKCSPSTQHRPAPKAQRTSTCARRRPVPCLPRHSICKTIEINYSTSFRSAGSWSACARTGGWYSATAPARSPTPSSTARYNYSFPFLDTGGAVTIDDNREWDRCSSTSSGPRWRPPSPSSAYQKDICASVLRAAGERGSAGAVRQEDAADGGDAAVRGGVLPRQGDRRSAQEVHPRNRPASPQKKKKSACLNPPTWMISGTSIVTSLVWRDGRYELLGSSVTNMINNLETFRDDYQDSDSIPTTEQHIVTDASDRRSVRH